MADRNFLIAVVGVLVGAAGVAVGWVGVKTSVDLAERSGSLEKSVIDARLAHLSFESAPNPIRVIYGVDFSVAGDAVVVGAVPLQIGNTGTRSIAELTVTFIYHEIFSRHAFEHLPFEADGTYEAQEMDRSFNEMGSQAYASYRIPHVPPGMRMAVFDPIGLPEMRYTEEFALESGASFTVDVHYGMSFDILITAKDELPIRKTVEVQVLDAGSLEDLTKALSQRIAVQDAKNLRDASSFLRYLSLLMFGRLEKQVVLVYPELRRVEAGGITVFQAEIKDDSLRTASYSPIAWRFLW